MRLIHLILLVTLATSQYSIAQKRKKTETPPKDWFLLDSKENKVQGISAEKAYNTLLKNKKSQTVTVAVIDSGIDIHHEDLKDVIWTNEDEIPNNGIDDDNNGYIDDIHGWSFIGGEEGDEYYELYEFARVYKKLNPKYGIDGADNDTINNPEFDLYKKVRARYLREYKSAEENYNFFNIVIHNQKVYSTILKRYLNKDSLTVKDVKSISSTDSLILKGKKFLLLINEYYGTIHNEFEDTEDYYHTELKRLDITEDYRKVVGDDPENPLEMGYGNNNVIGPDPDHGSHVAGIIAANRTNTIGIKGVADNVSIMPIRAIPEGDEYDKDVANAIRYAVDNGAKIINMSFGKDNSPFKFVVDSAARYAESNGVLSVHGAGNEESNIDTVTHYPTRTLNNQGIISTWIEVGASAAYMNKFFSSDFSNFGKEGVDVFAPGVEIYSCTPNNTYDFHDGTSMAAPVVTGIAAVLKSYFPNLTATQIKDIILKSVTDLSNQKVFQPGTTNVIKFGELSRTGGVVNLYEAIKLAESMSAKSDQ